ncbi:hypothetical protein JW906_02710 [bacterium]|nr:hypothetical protein [bacterium]
MKSEGNQKEVLLRLCVFLRERDIPGLATRISAFFNAFEDDDAPYRLAMCSRISKRPDELMDLIRFFRKGMEGAG